MPGAPATVILQIRLREPTWARYSAEASAAGKPLATYIRERLEQQDAVADELVVLRRLLEDLAGRGRAERDSDGHPVALETLLLLRQFAGPQKADLAQKELQRRGIAPWR